MKKALSVIFCILFLFLISCNKESSVVTATVSGLSFSADINDNGLCYSLNVNIDEKGKTETEIISNSDLNGMVLTFLGESVTINYKGLKSEVEWLPPNMHLDFIHSVFCDIREKDIKATFKNGEYTIEGENEKYNYELILGGSGLPIKIGDSKKSITAVIKDAKIKKEAE